MNTSSRWLFVPSLQKRIAPYHRPGGDGKMNKGQLALKELAHSLIKRQIKRNETKRVSEVERV